MKKSRAVTAIAAVAVAAVAIGGFAASGRGPREDPGLAVPLAPPAKAVSTPPKRTPPSTVKIDVRSLPVGAAPHLTYVRDRTVLGGAGRPVKVPGTKEIFGVARLQDSVLVLQLTPDLSSDLVVLDASGKQITQIPAVDSIVTSKDGQAVAYASGGRYAPTDQDQSGGTVYYQRSTTEAAVKLPLPKAYDLEVLGVTDHTVYFRSGGPELPWHLYKWQVDQPKPALLGKVPSPTVVAADGALAAGLTVFNDSGMCTALVTATTGTQLWRSCQYQLTHLSPGKVFGIGIPSGSAPYGDLQTVALDVQTGNRLRQWTGPSLRGSGVEDDDHLLLQWHDQDGPTSRSALVRCLVSTGSCELATPLSSVPLVIGS